MKGSQPYVFHKVVKDDTKPLNYYIMDNDAAKCLRCIYADSTKEDLMAAEYVMNDFFGTSAYGNFVLGNLSDEEWEKMGN